MMLTKTNITTKKMWLQLLSSFLLLFTPILPAPGNEDPIVNKEVDQYANHVMTEYGIPGLALAIIKGDQVLHRKNYGFANLEHQVPVSDASIFRVYSLTKPIISVGVFQLIEDGKLNLDDKISKYVPSLPSEWMNIQIKHLLTHSSGLPDMSSIPGFQDLTEAEAKTKVFAQKTKFKPGEKYDYNQTNFWLLKKVIETVSNTSLEDHIIPNQFTNAPDTAFFSVDSRDIIMNRVTAYFPFTKGTITIDHPYAQEDYAYAMNGLNITLDAFIEWDKRSRADQFLSPETKQKMWTPFPYTNSDKVFTYSWDKRMVNQKPSYGFSGSLVTAYRTFPESDMSIIFLANGMSSFFNIEDVVNNLAEIIEK